MSKSKIRQTEVEEVLTPKEVEQLAEIVTRINIANFFKGPWVCEEHPNHSEVLQYKHHEPHENCTGNLVIAKIEGKPVYRHALGNLIARTTSMLAVLEKALPTIEGEAARREFMPSSMNREEEYWTEMRALANKISAEIDRAYGREVPETEPDDYDYAADDRNFDAARERNWKK